MTLTEERRERHILLQVRGVGVRVGDVQQLSEAVDRLLNTEPHSLAFEFVESRMFDSGCIGQLVKAIRTLNLVGSPVYCIVNDEIWEGLRTVGLESLVHRVLTAADYWSEVDPARQNLFS